MDRKSSPSDFFGGAAGSARQRSVIVGVREGGGCGSSVVNPGLWRRRGGSEAFQAATALDFTPHALAGDQGPDSVGVVLSGTGIHAAAGLKEILRAGGFGLTHDPATAQYDELPRSAPRERDDPESSNEQITW